MARGKTTEDLSTLQMALVGYEVEKQRIEAKIREIQARLKGKPASSAAAGCGALIFMIFIERPSPKTPP